MIKSMTGYGRAEKMIDNMDISVEIRSVNHRYFEFSSRTPRQFSFLDERLKKYVSQKVGRGKVEVFVNIDVLNSAQADIEVNEPLALAYANAIKKIQNITGLDKNFSAVDIARYPDVLTVRKSEEDENAVTDAVLSVADEAIGKFIAMRETEGEKLSDDVCARCDTIAGFVDKVDELAAQSVVSYRERLETKIREVLDDSNIDEQRIVTEAAIFADKIAVDEETVRLKSHITQLKSLMKSSDSVGRKADFIVQEMNRETNTIGSKSVELQITQLVVEMKSEIEKIREQIQNIE